MYMDNRRTGTETGLLTKKQKVIKMKNQEIFEKVTAQIIENLEHATKWQKPWGNISSGDAPHNGITGHAYSGINWMVLVSAPYASNQWLTYKQAVACGGNVKKGEKGTQIVYFQMLKKEDKQGNVSAFPLLKVYTVFNSEQCENISGMKNYIVPVIPEGGVNALAASVGAKVKYQGSAACFIPSIDEIRMPAAEAFKSKAHHDATLLHELTHWTGHKSRLDRLSNDRFGSSGYAFEELVAELGAAMAGSLLGLPYEGLQHADYIANWLEVLKSDVKHVYNAAKLASKAINYLIDNSQEQEMAA